MAGKTLADQLRIHYLADEEMESEMKVSAETSYNNLDVDPFPGIDTLVILRVRRENKRV